jgi:hypothetical protein
MSERVACETCRKPMSAAAARCPHCGALQARAPASTHAGARERGGEKKALRDVSADEARAMLAVAAAREGRGVEAAAADQDPSLIAWLLLPHPRSSGGARMAEIVLTVLALPLVAATAFGAFLAWRTILRARRLGHPSLAQQTVFASGIFVLGTSLWATGLGLGTAIGVTVGCVVAVVIRAVIRSRSAARGTANELF